MKSPNQVFDEWTVQTGLAPRFHPIPDEIAKPFRDQVRFFQHHVTEIRQRHQFRRNIDLHLDFIDDGTCNAVAGLYESWGLIGLYKGLILLPMDLLWRMFSHPMFMPHIGDASQERRTAQHNDGIVTDYDDLVAMRLRQGRSPYARLPNSDIRRSAAKDCMELIWQFVAMHELIHILHGHVAYVGHKRSQQVPFMLESTHFGTSSLASSDDLDYQTIELWADTVAARVVLHDFLLQRPPRGFFTVRLVCDRLFIWSLAISTLIRLWEFKFDPAAIHTQRHPPSALRFILSMTCPSYRDVVPGLPELSNEEYWNAVAAGLGAANDGIAFCGGERLKEEDLDILNDPRVRAHRKALNEHFYTVLAPELMKHAYTDLQVETRKDTARG